MRVNSPLAPQAACAALDRGRTPRQRRLPQSFGPVLLRSRDSGRVTAGLRLAKTEAWRRWLSFSRAIACPPHSCRGNKLRVRSGAPKARAGAFLLEASLTQRNHSPRRRDSERAGFLDLATSAFLHSLGREPPDRRRPERPNPGPRPDLVLESTSNLRLFCRKLPRQVDSYRIESPR